ncbi:MAG: hypothetical protein IPP94_00800 [Ignavibacteria bacterium]|nr:hypothetical protein [Ignavibacteria bacterium]
MSAAKRNNGTATAAAQYANDARPAMPLPRKALRSACCIARTASIADALNRNTSNSINSIEGSEKSGTTSSKLNALSVTKLCIDAAYPRAITGSVTGMSTRDAMVPPRENGVSALTRRTARATARTLANRNSIEMVSSPIELAMPPPNDDAKTAGFSSVSGRRWVPAFVMKSTARTVHSSRIMPGSRVEGGSSGTACRARKSERIASRNARRKAVAVSKCCSTMCRYSAGFVRRVKALPIALPPKTIGTGR